MPRPLPVVGFVRRQVEWAREGQICEVKYNRGENQTGRDSLTRAIGEFARGGRFPARGGQTRRDRTQTRAHPHNSRRSFAIPEEGDKLFRKPGQPELRRSPRFPQPAKTLIISPSLCKQ